jgi:nucleoside-diphosphate-sugar epimerase
MARVAFVTGGTGFVGINLVHALVGQGWRVVAIHRRTSNLRWLGASGAELVEADVVEPDSIMAAMPDGVDAVFHMAGHISTWRPDKAKQAAINVGGTRNVATAALARRAKRYIQTSSISAWGPIDGDLLQEDSPSRAQEQSNIYALSKLQADEEVLRLVAEGLDATIVCPCGILGRYDISTWGRLFTLLKNGDLPGLPPGGQPFGHVREVVAAHIAAVDRGATGERYILGGTAVSYAELGQHIADLVGVAPPRVLPGLVLSALARVSDLASRVTKKEPDLTPDGVAFLNATFGVDASKAEKDLGYVNVPIEESLSEQYAWLVDNGLLDSSSDG